MDAHGLQIQTVFQPETAGFICKDLMHNHKLATRCPDYFMKTYTMKDFNLNSAWEQRFNVDVKEGDILLLDEDKEFVVLNVFVPRDIKNCSVRYLISPIDATLIDYEHAYNEAAKKNPRYMEQNKFPNFSFEVESLWFFSRNVKIM